MEFNYNLTKLFPDAKMPTYKLVEKLKKGVFMKGKILTKSGGSDCVCGGKFVVKKDFVFGVDYPVCTNCKRPPNSFRVRYFFPNVDGKPKPKDYETFEGKPLTTIAMCIQLIGSLSKDTASDSFNIANYDQEARKKMTVENCLNKYIERVEERYNLPEGHRKKISKGGRDKIKSNVKNHLRKFFETKKNSKDEIVPRCVDEITKKDIIRFNDSYATPFQARNPVGELKAFLNFVKEELELIKEVPSFPEISRARELRPDEVPDISTQVKVINSIQNEMYKDFWILTAATASRPCEIRCLLVKDICFESGMLSIQKHFSGGKIESGRKSIQANEAGGIIKHKLDNFLIELLQKRTFGKKINDPIFSGERAEYASEVSLRNAWNRACLKVGVKLTPYVGSKHTTLTDFVEKYGLEVGVKFSKHRDIRTLKKYAKDKSEEKSFVDSKRFFLISGGQVVGDENSSSLSASNY